MQVPERQGAFRRTGSHPTYIHICFKLIKVLLMSLLKATQLGKAAAEQLKRWPQKNPAETITSFAAGIKLFPVTFLVFTCFPTDALAILQMTALSIACCAHLFRCCACES